MQRETKEIISGSHKAMVKTYVTESELASIQEAVETAKSENKSKTSIQRIMGRGLVKALVVSFDGSAENIVERMTGELPFDEYIAFVGQLDSIIAKKKV